MLKGYIVGGMVIIGEEEFKGQLLNPRQAQTLFYPKGADPAGNPVFDSVNAMNPLPGSPESISIDPAWTSYDFNPEDTATLNLYRRVTSKGIHVVK